MDKEIELKIADLKNQQNQLLTGTTCDITETEKTHNELQREIDLLKAQLAPDETFTGISQLRG